MQNAFASMRLGGTGGPAAVLSSWWPIILGLLVLYVPTYAKLAETNWSSEAGAHGPLVLAAVAWSAWRLRERAIASAERPALFAGTALLALGLASYTVGRAVSVVILEVGSQFPVLLGVLLLAGGWAPARVLWFPLVYMIFLVPLPGLLVDAITGPLKAQVSALAEAALYALGYPIARSGVVLAVGPYQLLVADACSGLHSLYSLGAMGLLYMYLVGRKSVLHNAILLISVLPFAFLANVVRVIVLVLVTFHLGDEAGQGFLHELSGIVLFVVALLMLIGLDALLAAAGRVTGRRR